MKKSSAKNFWQYESETAEATHVGAPSASFIIHNRLLPSTTSPNLYVLYYDKDILLVHFCQYVYGINESLGWIMTRDRNFNNQESFRKVLDVWHQNGLRWEFEDVRQYACPAAPAARTKRNFMSLISASNNFY